MTPRDKLRLFVKIMGHIFSFGMGMAVMLRIEYGARGSEWLILPFMAALIFLGWQWRILVENVKK